jgi:hypothetical protein
MQVGQRARVGPPPAPPVIRRGDDDASLGKPLVERGHERSGYRHRGTQAVLVGQTGVRDQLDRARKLRLT